MSPSGLENVYIYRLVKEGSRDPGFTGPWQSL